jgi:hypothetical protein
VRLRRKRQRSERARGQGKRRTEPGTRQEAEGQGTTGSAPLWAPDKNSRGVSSLVWGGKGFVAPALNAGPLAKFRVCLTSLSAALTRQTNHKGRHSLLESSAQLPLTRFLFYHQHMLQPGASLLLRAADPARDPNQNERTPNDQQLRSNPARPPRQPTDGPKLSSRASIRRGPTPHASGSKPEGARRTTTNGNNVARRGAAKHQSQQRTASDEGGDSPRAAITEPARGHGRKQHVQASLQQQRDRAEHQAQPARNKPTHDENRQPRNGSQRRARTTTSQRSSAGQAPRLMKTWRAREQGGNSKQQRSARSSSASRESGPSAAADRRKALAAFNLVCVLIV